MKYIVEIEEWENNKKEFNNLGRSEALYFIMDAMSSACHCDKEGIENSVNQFMEAANRQWNKNTSFHPISNPVLTILLNIFIFEKMTKNLEDKNPELLKKICEEANDEYKQRYNLGVKE